MLKEQLLLQCVSNYNEIFIAEWLAEDGLFIQTRTD